ncbi:MAG: hypothetical protein OXG62_05510 [Nitrospinae bacterium]|nr:hypothetical protein [Nitrospinota bacterium]
MKHEPVLAKLNELRKDAQGEGGVEEKALYHMFCFISYEVGPFADFVEVDKAPAEKKDTAAGPRAGEYLGVLTELRDEVDDDPEDMEFIALDYAASFISQVSGDFQAYLDEAGE